MMILEDRFRYLIGFIVFCSTATVYIARSNLATAIVDMALPRESQNKNNNNTFANLDVCPRDEIKIDTNRITDTNRTISSERLRDTLAKLSRRSTTAPQFDWDEKTQGLMLGAFYWGYFAFQTPGGRFAELFGPRILVTIGLLGSAVQNLLTPLLAKYFIPFLVSRVLLGAVQAMVFPGAFAIATKWIPYQERSTFLALAMVGGSTGAVISSAISGYLCRYGFAGGWPSVFYVTGTIAAVIGTLYFFIVSDDPETHSWVSATELKYIRSNIPVLRVKHDRNRKLSSTSTLSKSAPPPPTPSVPWIAILTDRAVLALFFVRFTITLAFNTMLLKLPEYMEHVMGIPLEDAGLYSSAMFAMSAISLFVAGFAADYVLNRRLFGDRTRTRKIFEGITLFGGAALTIVIPLVGCSRTGFLFAILGTQMAAGFAAGGDSPLPSDLTNQFTATIFGLSNMVGMTTGFIAPYITGVMLDASPLTPKRQWSYIFYATAALNFIAGIVFCLFASAEPAAWGLSNSAECEIDNLSDKKDVGKSPIDSTDSISLSVAKKGSTTSDL